MGHDLSGKSVRVHDLPDRELLEKLRAIKETSLSSLLETQQPGGVDEAPGVTRGTIRHLALFAAQYSLILDRSEAKAKDAFGLAATYAERALGVPGPRDVPLRPWGGGPTPFIQGRIEVPGCEGTPGCFGRSVTDHSRYLAHASSAMASSYAGVLSLQRVGLFGRQQRAVAGL
jgi:hypothetical protein